MHKKYIYIILMLALCARVGAQNPGVGIDANKPPFSLDELQRRSFLFFWEQADATYFQVLDRYPTLDFSSIASTGFGLSCYLVGAERGWISRAQAAERVLNTLRALKNLPQGPEPSGVSGHKGFFYHFLDLKKAQRYEKVELSSIDTGLLMAGVLSCMSYFDRDNEVEKSIRELADFLFRRVEFDWFLNEHQRMSMGWFPERGFLGADWRGYNEAMVLVVMALGSPTHPVPAAMWEQWCKPYYRAAYKGQDMVNFGPLFGHQYSHCWIDFKGIQDPYMKKMGIDYFENSRRATLANRQYCVDNPKKFKGYGPNIWGLTACDGPGDLELGFEGRKQAFHGYGARGVAIDYDLDDGTIAPTAAVSSLPFAPEFCLPAAEAMWNRWPIGRYGFFDAYNESFTWPDQWQRGQKEQPYWVDYDYLGIDQGPMALMIENYQSGLIWKLMQKNPYIIRGLKRAGFTGGWIDTAPTSPGPWANGEKVKPNPDVPAENPSFFRLAQYNDAAGNLLPYQYMEPQAPATTASKNATGNKPTTTAKYPLVVYLHGSGERGTDNRLQMTNGVYAFAEKWMRQQHPHYLVVPQCPPNENWGGVSRDWQKVTLNAETYSRPGKMVIELIEQMLREHPDIDRQRIYLTGLSMGGFGTFDLLMRRPDLFAAGLPLCGGGDPAFAERLRGIPLWVFHGRLDDAVYPKYSWQIVESLRKAGGRVKYTEYSTLGHSIWNQVYYDPAVLNWLFQQKKR